MVVVCFQKFETKYKKMEIYQSDKRIYFDHDYLAETLAKRKAYTHIIRILWEKGYDFKARSGQAASVF